MFYLHDFGTAIFLSQLYWILRSSYGARYNLIDIKEDQEQVYEICNPWLKKNHACYLWIDLSYWWEECNF